LTADLADPDDDEPTDADRPEGWAGRAADVLPFPVLRRAGTAEGLVEAPTGEQSDTLADEPTEN
jgi:hypothetical protein